MIADTKSGIRGGLNGAAQCLDQSAENLKKLWEMDEYMMTGGEIAVTKEIVRIIKGHISEITSLVAKFEGLAKQRT